MENLNYQHLRYFWAVARAETLTQAATNLRLAPQTVSTQIKDLEHSLGQPLFVRTGRRLVLTDVGKAVYRYADEIFSLGKELSEMLAGQSVAQAPRFVIGVADVLPKLVAHRLIEPATTMEAPVRVVVYESGLRNLLADLALHQVDVVLSDAPIPPSIKIKAYNHLLGESGVRFMATPELVARYQSGFPYSLNGAPFLLPTEGTSLRGQLDRWFESRKIYPKIIGEFDDSALLKTFAQEGAGVCAVPSAVENATRRQYQVEFLGKAEGITERFYAISVERKIKHPAIAAIYAVARTNIF